MKIKHFLPFLILAGLLLGNSHSLYGQIFISSGSSIGEYSLTGATENASLITGLNNAEGIAVSGSDIYVANYGDDTPYASLGTVGKYTFNASTSGTVNASLISGLNETDGIAVSGSNIFVVSSYVTGLGYGRVGKYTLTGVAVNATMITNNKGPTDIAVSGSDIFVVSESTVGEYTLTGKAVKASLISGLSGDPAGIAVSGSDIYLANLAKGTIGEYTLTGGTVNAALITGLSGPRGIVVSGSDIYVANQGSGTIGEYTLAGATVNADLISDTNGASYLAVVDPAPSPAVLVREPSLGVAVPEPSCFMLVGLGAACLMLRRRITV